MGNPHAHKYIAALAHLAEIHAQPTPPFNTEVPGGCQHGLLAHDNHNNSKVSRPATELLTLAIIKLI